MAEQLQEQERQNWLQRLYKDSPPDILLRDNPADKAWLDTGGSPWALAARRVFITTTNPHASPYNESPQELQRKYGTFGSFMKGVWSGHSPTEVPAGTRPLKKLFFYFKKLLFAAGNTLSLILKSPEWFFYGLQLSLHNHSFLAKLCKPFRFLFSFIFSPLNNSVRLEGANVHWLWKAIFMYLPAIAITSIFMATGLGPALLAIMGVSISLAALSIPATAALEYLLLSITFGVSTYAGFNIATKGAPGRAFASIHEDRSNTIKKLLKTALHHDTHQSTQDKIVEDAAKFISMLEGRYHFKFSEEAIERIKIAINRRINKLEVDDKSNHGVIVKIIKEEFILDACKPSQATFGKLFTDQIREKFVAEIKESLINIQKVGYKIQQCEKAMRLQSVADVKAFFDLPENKGILSQDAQALIDAGQDLPGIHGAIRIEIGNLKIEFSQYEDKLIATKSNLVEHIESELVRANAELSKPENMIARIQSFLPDDRTEITPEIVKMMLAEKPKLFEATREADLTELVQDYEEAWNSVAGKLFLATPFDSRKAQRIIETELAALGFQPQQPAAQPAAAAARPEADEQKGEKNLEREVLNVIKQAPKALDAAGGRRLDYSPKFFAQKPANIQPVVAPGAAPVQERDDKNDGPAVVAQGGGVR